jgi:hypothetical protein
MRVLAKQGVSAEIRRCREVSGSSRGILAKRQVRRRVKGFKIGICVGVISKAQSVTVETLGAREFRLCIN